MKIFIAYFLIPLILVAVIDIISYICALKYKKHKPDIHLDFIIFQCIAMFFLNLIAMFLIASVSIEEVSYTYSNEYELRCLQDYISQDQTVDAKGKFLLCYGNFSYDSNTRDVYNVKFIAKDENGVFRVRSLEQDDKYGFSIDGKNTYEEVIKYSYKKSSNPYLNWIDNGIYKIDETWTVTDRIFHVGEDAILNDKNIDLK